MLDRNRFTCQMYGAASGETHPYDAARNTRLHIGHINEGASNITLQRPDLAKLLVQVRRATAADQRVLLEWLVKKIRHLSGSWLRQNQPFGQGLCGSVNFYFDAEMIPSPFEYCSNSYEFSSK